MRLLSVRYAGKLIAEDVEATITFGREAASSTECHGCGKRFAPASKHDFDACADRVRTLGTRA